MAERLQKLISGAGICSRRAAEELIAAGRVTVNGRRAALGESADPLRDRVEVDGVRLRPARERRYIMLNKPRGYVTTLSDEKGRRTVAELVRGAGGRLYPVGRLDMNSEGLLIMTDDGEAANALMHPAREVEKVYRVTVKGSVSPAQLEKMRSVTELEGRPVRNPRVDILGGDEGATRLRFVIHEGRNREIRRICAAAGLEVSRLVRVAEGELRLGELPRGKWRELTRAELEYIRGLVSRPGGAEKG